MSWAKFSVLTIFVLDFPFAAQGLLCMTCDGAATHEECDVNGVLRKCLPNEERCAIEERKIEFGPRRLIFKSCKQPLACNNNFVQNERAAWWPEQCNPDFPNSVCRCCCHTDSCNVGRQSCMGMPITAAPIICDPDYLSLSNGQMKCSQNNSLGSICSFDCDVAYLLMGSKHSTCESNGLWSSPAPFCTPIRCSPHFRFLKNGLIDCSDKNNPESICSFECNEGYNLSGSAISSCTYTSDFISAEWSHRAPVCKPIKCPDQGVIRNGAILCDRHNDYTSRCEFRCKNNQYVRYPPEVTSNECLVTGNWSRLKPCCIKPCPPHAVFDLVMALDSSSSVGVESWNITLEFVKSFAKLYDLSVLNFALFRYNSLIDSTSEIRFDSGFEPAKLLDAIGKIPYDGTGTNTGKALKYAGEVMLSLGRGRRRGAQAVVVVVTDGKSLDDVTIPAQNLRRSGIKTFAVGVQPLDKKLDLSELRVISGDPDRVAIAEQGYIDLDEDFAKQLSRDVCGDPCLQPDLEDVF